MQIGHLVTAESRLADAMERIADAFEHLAKLGEQFYDRLYPVVTKSPVTVGVAKYPDAEKAQPEQTLPGEDLTEGLGPREKKLVEARFAKQKVRGASQTRN